MTTYVWPCLSYEDAFAAIRFLVEAFGFEERAVHKDATGDLVEHAELLWPAGGGIMLGSPKPGSDLDIPAGKGMIYLVTQDPDALYQRATAAGATVIRELADKSYGSRDFIVRDPQGVIWSFGTYVGE